MPGSDAALSLLAKMEGMGLSREQISAAQKEANTSGRTLKQVLVELGLVQEASFLKEMAARLGIRYAEVGPEDVDEQAVSLVPAKVVEHYGIMPLSVQDGQLEVAIDDPFADEMIDELFLVLGRRVVPVLCPAEAIVRAARTHYGVGAETIERLVAAESIEAAAEGAEAREGDLAEASAGQQASVIKLVNQILLDAIKERATDIHLESYEDELRARYRIDGVLREAGLPQAARHFRPAVVSRIKIMANLDIAEKRLPHDGRASVRIANEHFDLRISILPVPEGEGVVIRILPRRPIFSDLGSLGFEDEDRAKIEKLLEQPHGVILLTGPTGSGKTTTLYACLTKLNRPGTKIITIEDPIEYRIRGVEQMQVSPQIGFTFARALRSMLRHDPDIMLVGEIRDRETASITIRSALTGHLVFSTLHTNDSAGAVPRLLDMGIEPYLISSSVIGMVAQRLVRSICPRCVEPCDADREVAGRLGVFPDGGEDIRLYRGRGCEHCRLSGYYGRTAICETLPMTDRIRELTQARRPATEIRRCAREEGMRGLRAAGWEKVKHGVTTVTEVLRVTQEEEQGD